MGYMKVSQAAEKWKISARRVRKMCADGKVEGVIRKGNLYLIPMDAKKPQDGRRNSHKTIEEKGVGNLFRQESFAGSELDKLTADVRVLEVAHKAVISPQIQQLLESTQKLSSAVISVIQSDALQAALNIGQRISNMLAALDFTPMLKKFSEAMIPLKYIGLLERLRWPVF